MAKSRGRMLLEQQKKGVVVEVEDSFTKEVIIKQLIASGISATKRESLQNLKKKLAQVELAKEE